MWSVIARPRLRNWSFKAKWSRLWPKAAADLCELHGWTLLVVTDYSSYYIEVARLCATSTQAVVCKLKTMFARFGIPEILVTDNGPQFFRLTSFKYLLGFGLSIMSLHRLTTLSQMVKPKTLCGQWSVYLRNAKKPACRNFKLYLTGEIRLMRAQRLMGLRCRTLLPMSQSRLQPSCSLRGDVRVLAGGKWRQKNYYDRHAKFLKPISLGETCACKASSWESVVSCLVRGLCGSSQFPCKDWWCCLPSAS